MKQFYVKYLIAAMLTGGFLLTSCRSAREATAHYELSKVEGSMITIDSTWDANPDKKAIEVLKPYKDKVDAMMYEVIGTSEMKMDKGKPESLLSNLVASVLQQAAAQLLGKPADMGLVNMGGLRNILPKGEITVGEAFEVLPFENSLCILTMKGSDMKQLFKAIASLNGEGVSGIHLDITKTGKLLNATIGGKPVEDNQLYTVATIDYLADGNGRMDAFLQAEKRECPEGATLRGLFIDYIRKQTAEGKVITSQLDGRITIK
ncbi:5'-nucleotidase C-terminal domain-containing protein [uncultured Bacteroides sp.]|uniref:5'-nucleotidase C-terminal domain-containing protein n=1 Tax=uncultured Bacteroides sp. TaxID=162156 RepID=UPI0025F296D4|nr:5'-nucleotidase [uncultured Bacteroides sp.]